MSHPERPKPVAKEHILERGIREDDAAQVVGGVVEMLKKYEKEPFFHLLEVIAIKIESDYSYKEYQDMDSAPAPVDSITESGRESVKMVARALKRLGSKYKLLEEHAPLDERPRVRQQLIAELESLRGAIHEKRAEWVKALIEESKS